MKAAGTLIAAVALMRSPCTHGTCQIPATRPLPGPGGGQSEPGGLYPGEAFYAEERVVVEEGDALPGQMELGSSPPAA